MRKHGQKRHRTKHNQSYNRESRIIALRKRLKRVNPLSTKRRKIAARYAAIDTGILDYLITKRQRGRLLQIATTDKEKHDIITHRDP